MDYQLQLMAKFIDSVSSLKKLYGGQDRLPPAAVFHQDSQSSRYCAICLTDISGGDSYRKLPECGHCFHARCIDAWLKSHSTCPLCRTQVPQIISLNENHYQWDSITSNILTLLHNFVEKICNPLNEELTSMLCDSIRI